MTRPQYVLRTIGPDRTSHGGFVWPASGIVTAPDWKPAAKCGNGLHGLLMGEGDGGNLNWSPDAIWQVVRPIGEVINIGRKVKFQSCEIIFEGNRKAATDHIISLGASGLVVGCYLTGGDRATLTGGDWATLTGGHGAVFIAVWWGDNRRRVATAEVGSNGLKPGVKYLVEGGVFKEVAA
jgi:hypothetical protein